MDSLGYARTRRIFVKKCTDLPSPRVQRIVVFVEFSNKKSWENGNYVQSFHMSGFCCNTWQLNRSLRSKVCTTGNPIDCWDALNCLVGTWEQKKMFSVQFPMQKNKKLQQFSVFLLTSTTSLLMKFDWKPPQPSGRIWSALASEKSFSLGAIISRSFTVLNSNVPSWTTHLLAFKRYSAQAGEQESFIKKSFLCKAWFDTLISEKNR